MNIVLLGDSIAEGLGVAGCSYADGIAANLRATQQEVQITNLAGSANQITSSQALLAKIVSMRPDIVIIAHGITEAIIRPVPSAMKFVPARWRQIGWLDPRPYFSRRWWKRIYHKIESSLRWRIKVYLIKKYGGCTLTAREEFERLMFETVERLLQQTPANIILLTHNGIDERYYPGSLTSLNHYKHSIERVVLGNRTPRVQFCDISDLLEEWSDFFDDHFHPNARGHSKIAKAICTLLPGNTIDTAITVYNT